MVCSIKSTPDPIMEIWARYKSAPSIEDRNRLMEQYLPVVYKVASKFAKRLPRNVQFDGMVSAGVMGLMEAIRTFDPARGVRFESFCSLRVQGAILDELRATDWVPRLTRTRADRLEHATSRLASRGVLRPTMDEIVEELGLTAHEAEILLEDVAERRMICFSQGKDKTVAGHEVRSVDQAGDPTAEQPGDRIERRDWWEWVTRGLSVPQRAVIVMYYRDGLTMAEIADALGCSPPSVCQICAMSLAILRSRIRKTTKPAVDC